MQSKRCFFPGSNEDPESLIPPKESRICRIWYHQRERIPPPPSRLNSIGRHLLWAFEVGVFVSKALDGPRWSWWIMLDCDEFSGCFCCDSPRSQTTNPATPKKPNEDRRKSLLSEFRLFCTATTGREHRGSSTTTAGLEWIPPTVGTLKLTIRPWKWMLGRLVRFLLGRLGLFSGGFCS